jgi:hypothetical protein
MAGAACAGLLAAGPLTASAFADDGLTRDAASRVQRAALQRVSGTVIEIDRDVEGRTVSYSAKVLTRRNAVRELLFTRQLRVLANEAEDRVPGLTYARAQRVKAAARRRMNGIVIALETQGSRYVVNLLTRGTREYQLRLSRSYRVLSTRRVPAN